jgi:hypothetical protein
MGKNDKKKADPGPVVDGSKKKKGGGWKAQLEEEEKQAKLE